MEAKWNVDGYSKVLVFYVNGKKISEDNVNPEWSLLMYLRNKLSLCGTKLACGEGGCGACTIMVSKFNRTLKKVEHYPVNACLAPVCSMHGLAVTTVEGIGSTKTKLHPVQERIAKAHGSQCGFCTPGIVMSMYTLLRNQSKPKMADLHVAFQGNLCRCTGYRPIIEGYKTFTEEWELQHVANGIQNGKTKVCSMGDQCCKLQNSSKCNLDDNGKLFEPNKFVPYDSSQEPIFPPELKLTDKYDSESLMFKGRNITWFRPTTIEELLKLVSENPGAKIVGGNTEIGVEVKFKNKIYPIYIQPSSVFPLNQIIVTNEGIQIGAAVTLNEIEIIFKNIIEEHPEWKTRVCKAVVEMLQWFSSKQIRSVASIGGNIMTGSPISDLNPIWMAIGANLHLRSASKSRIVIMDEHFFTGYRQTLAEPNEILEYIEIPFTQEYQYVFAHKQSRRRDDDIAIVNCAINVELSQDHKIENIKMAFGGMAPTTILTKKTKDLIGQTWNENLLETAYQLLLDDLPLADNAPGGMISYRRSLAISFFFKTFLNISQAINLKIDERDLSALTKFTSKPPKSSQCFHVMEHNEHDTIGRPTVHTNALNHATGEAVYTDDLPIFEKELHLAFIFSKKAHAKLLSIDVSEALKAPNVVDCILLEDISEERNVSGIMNDEEYFRRELITSQYQILGGILATDQLSAKQAVNLVNVSYEEYPAIVTIDQAIEQNSFLNCDAKINFGDVPAVFPTCKHVISGTVRTGYQEHFYLEPQTFLAVPREGEEIEIYASSQDHAGLAARISILLGVDQNKVNVRIKRIGGGFGGKEITGTKLAPYVALAARKTNRPVRLVFERDEDMSYTGGRHATLTKYKLGFDDLGKIHCADVEMFLNGGYSEDISKAAVTRAIAHITNSANIKNVRIMGKVCRTHLPTNTAFRGTGTPQANFISETMLREVAEYLKKDYVEIVKVNMYSEGDLTIYNQPILDCNIQRCFEECLVNSDYFQRKKAVEQFNKENRWKKRGIDIITSTYGVGFGANSFQQGGALVLIYRDGSVLLTHGGVEMGQGLHTKMIQVASRELGISVNKIHTSEASTDKVPNTSPTVASMSSDLNGMAIRNACTKLKKRLEPVIKSNPKSTWEEQIAIAYNNRISLAATGFHCEPPINWDWDTNSGNKLFNYFSFGAAVTEVEIDCLTGDHQILRTDIVMDVGNSLNPAIDIGQIEGGFMHGYGLFVMEQMVTLPDGTYASKGPGSYKIPGFGDIPIEFNVALLKDSSNPRAVYSSKAIGEPPLVLASSVVFAIREAIKAARRENNIMESFQLHAPATAEQIRMACQDHLTDKVKPQFSTWNVPYL